MVCGERNSFEFISEFTSISGGQLNKLRHLEVMVEDNQ
jgi:hypothetical protein